MGLDGLLSELRNVNWLIETQKEVLSRVQTEAFKKFTQEKLDALKHRKAELEKQIQESE